MNNGESSYRRFLCGEKDAFADIVELYRKSLIFFINRYTNNLSEAEEIAEDCFVELVVNPRRYNFKASLKTYLFTIARNKAVDRIRKKKFILKESEEILLNASEDYSELEGQVFKSEEKAILHNSICKLKDDYRTSLYLVYFENMSYDETARVMKKSKKQGVTLLFTFAS